MSKTSNRRRSTLKLVLASVAILGVGAAITTAVWTDEVFFGATATASSFDLQGRAVLTPEDAWQDLGVPGETTDVAPIVLDPTPLAALSPDEIYTVNFELCNTGTTAGTITAISVPTVGGGTMTAAEAAEVSAVVTAPITTAALPSDPLCENPVVGTLEVTTTIDFPGSAQGKTVDIGFSVTGESNAP